MTERDWRIFREDNDIQVKGNNVPNPIRNWKEISGMVSNRVMRNIEQNGFDKPMPIQQQAIPIASMYKDMIGLAPTGSGKSAAFLLPLISFLEKQPPI